jgi:hypothetical protein
MDDFLSSHGLRERLTLTPWGPAWFMTGFAAVSEFG